MRPAAERGSSGPPSADRQARLPPALTGCGEAMAKQSSECPECGCRIEFDPARQPSGHGTPAVPGWQARLRATGYRLPATGDWLLASGYWLPKGYAVSQERNNALREPGTVKTGLRGRQPGREYPLEIGAQAAGNKRIASEEGPDKGKVRGTVTDGSTL